MRATELEVLVDAGASGSGAVALELREGLLRRATGEVEIGERGYRVQLPGITAERARELMLGMVRDL